MPATTSTRSRWTGSPAIRPVRYRSSRSPTSPNPASVRPAAAPSSSASRMAPGNCNRAGFSPGQTDSTYTWNSTSVSTYMDASGNVGFQYCGCPTNGAFTISSNMVQWTLNLIGGIGAGGELLRHADHRRAAAGGDLHGQLDQYADRVVVEVRRLQHLDGAEPEPYVFQHRGLLHGRADRDQPVRQQHEHQEQLHHRRQSAGGELLRYADHRRADSDGDLHRHLHE